MSIESNRLVYEAILEEEFGLRLGQYGLNKGTPYTGQKKLQYNAAKYAAEQAARRKYSEGLREFFAMSIQGNWEISPAQAAESLGLQGRYQAYLSEAGIGYKGKKGDSGFGYNCWALYLLAVNSEKEWDEQFQTKYPWIDYGSLLQLKELVQKKYE